VLQGKENGVMDEKKQAKAATNILKVQRKEDFQSHQHRKSHPC
jgi:hypothetical protein